MLERLIWVLATIIDIDFKDLPTFVILSALNQVNHATGSQVKDLVRKGYMDQTKMSFDSHRGMAGSVSATP
jgi:hypothetical protein